MPRSTDQPVAGSEFPPLSLCEDLGREAGKGNIQFRLWFDGGGVVLIAEHTAFRVHASFLSRHSPVFKELFTVPPAPNGERIGGCRVFHTSDSAEDLNYLLQLTYDAPCLLRPINPSGDTAKPSFAMISALMRLGHKYEFFTLVDDAARYLETYYTTNFDVWEQLRDGNRYRTLDGKIRHAPRRSLPMLPARSRRPLGRCEALRGGHSSLLPLQCQYCTLPSCAKTAAQGIR